MITKIKIIAAVVAVLIIVTTIICGYIYVNKLNNKINDLTVTVTEQNSVIQSLNCQIEDLEKNIDSFRETINITNDYISNIESIKESESTVKQEIYQEVINDEETKNWFEESVPANLIDVLLRNSDDLVCN